MGNVLIDESILQGWADVVREKQDLEDKMKPSVLLEKTREMGQGGSNEDFWRMYDGLKNYTRKFADMISLTSMPQIDTSNGTDFSYMFMNCTSLISMPELDTSNGSNMSDMFKNCTSLTSIPKLNVSNNTVFNNLFDACKSLVSLPELDVSNASKFSYTFRGCNGLQNILFVEASIKKSVSFSNSPLLSDASIQSIIDGLADLTDSTSPTLTLHADVKAKLTETQIATITNKNWTLA